MSLESQSRDRHMEGDYAGVDFNKQTQPIKAFIQERSSMNKSEQINELAAALAKAQGVMEGAKKDAENPFFKSNYADLASVWDACRKPLSDNGLSIVQLVNDKLLETILMHASGQWVRSTVPLNPVKNDPQGLGSCISYMRRYSLAAMVGVYQVDDDAEAAMPRARPVHTVSYENKNKPVQGYQPAAKVQGQGNLDTSKPPQVGSGVIKSKPASAADGLPEYRGK